MRSMWRVLPALVLVWVFWQQTQAADVDDEVVTRQKEKAQANWKRVHEGKQPAVHVETDNFLFYASKSYEKDQLKNWGGMLDELFKETKKSLGLDGEGKKPVWQGKLTVYMFDDRRDYNAFVRGVLKKKPTDVGTGAYSLRGEEAFVAAAKPTSAEEMPIDTQVAEQLITAIFQKFAGENNSIPDWFYQGFVTATMWRAANTEPLKKKADADRKKVLAMLAKKGAKGTKELFAGSLSGEDLYLIRGSVMEYLAYGPDADKFPTLAKAFRTDMPNAQPKPINDVLATVKLYPEKLDRLWSNWVKAGGK